MNFQENVLNLSSPVTSLRSGRLMALFPWFCASSRRPSRPSLCCQYLVEIFSTWNGIWGNFSPRHSPSPPSSFSSARPALNSLTRPITFVILWALLLGFCEAIIISMLSAIYHSVKVAIINVTPVTACTFLLNFFYRENNNNGDNDNNNNWLHQVGLLSYNKQDKTWPIIK